MEAAAQLRRNIELKTRHGDLEKAKQVLRAMGAAEQQMLVQTDTCFRVGNGRLKLREIEGVGAELIWYAREDRAQTRGSDYVIVKVPQVAEMIEVLSRANGVVTVVKKRREWFLWQNVRVHLDDVEGLGRFIEFEAVMSEGEDEATGHARIEHLCEKLGIEKSQHLAGSYVDLVLAKAP